MWDDAARNSKSEHLWRVSRSEPSMKQGEGCRVTFGWRASKEGLNSERSLQKGMEEISANLASFSIFPEDGLCLK